MQEKKIRLDLFDFVSYGWKHKSKIFIFTFVMAVLAAVIMFFTKNTYQAYGAFFPSSAVIGGRINLFRDVNQEWLDIYGGENEVDRAYIYANSAGVVSKIIDKFDMAGHYGIDVNKNPDDKKKVYKRFMKNYQVSRSGFKHIEVFFKDKNDSLAAEVVNGAIAFTEDEIKQKYLNAFNQLITALNSQTDSVRITIGELTDSLVRLRTRYGIYDLISPGRKNLISYKVSGSGEQFARGLETIQEVEELKDKLVQDEAKYVSIVNEFNTGLNYNIPMIHVVQWAGKGNEKYAPFRTLTVLTTALIALLFAWFIAVLYEFFIRNKAMILPNDV